MIGNLAGTIESLQADKAEILAALKYAKRMCQKDADHLYLMEIIDKHSTSTKQERQERNYRESMFPQDGLEDRGSTRTNGPSSHAESIKLPRQKAHSNNTEGE